MHLTNRPGAATATNARAAKVPEAIDSTGTAWPASYEDAIGAAHCEDTAWAADCEDTAGAGDCEDATDLATTVDADLFETLVQEYNYSTPPEQEHPAPPDQPHAARSQPSDPGPPLPIHVERGISDGPSLIVDSFPYSSPGAPIPGAGQGLHVYESSQDVFGSSTWAPFRSQRDWEIAHWAKMRGPTSSALSELLAIPEVRVVLHLLFYVTNADRKVIDDLGLSYSTPKQLNDIINNMLPGCPPFKCQDLVIAGDTLPFYFHDILQCIRTLYGNPEFTCDLAFVPECHYTNHERTCRVYNEMHTGDWWWAVQVRSHISGMFKLTINVVIDEP